jgi:hypothetical protein
MELGAEEVISEADAIRFAIINTSEIGAIAFGMS